MQSEGAEKERKKGGASPARLSARENELPLFQLTPLKSKRARATSLRAEAISATG